MEKTKKFAEELGNKFPILADPERKASVLFGVDRVFGLSKRVTFIFDNKGKLVEIDKKVNLGSHGKDIVTKLDELKIEKREE